MVASTFGGAFDKLDRELQRTIIANLSTRRKNYCRALVGQRWPEIKAILIGDRPGPGAKKLPATHHHTPFYSTKNSSLWINQQLAKLGVNEDNLLWLNAYDMNGVPSHPCHIEGWGYVSIFALGGNAAKWLDQWPGKKYTKVQHPQAWKRFHSSEPYPLLGYLQLALDL